MNAFEDIETFEMFLPCGTLLQLAKQGLGIEPLVSSYMKTTTEQQFII